MKYEIYADIRMSPEYNVFEFMSVGRNGCIRKRIIFQPTESAYIYNLAFGDVVENGNVDDFKISDNGDRDKVLATIVKVVDLYISRYPKRWIYFAGSTTPRTRLYRMAVSIHLEELSSLFEIFAEVEGKGGFFRYRKGLNIESFLIRRNLLNLLYEKENQSSK